MDGSAAQIVRHARKAKTRRQAMRVGDFNKGDPWLELAEARGRVNLLRERMWSRNVRGDTSPF